MSTVALIISAGGAVVVAWVADRRHSLARRLESPSPAEVEDAGAALEPSRAEQVEAIQALCYSSEPYVLSRLASYEPEVAHLAELVLELDDQSPKPTGYED